MGTGSLRSIQTLITVSIVCGPVSMIIGGVFLSLVAIVCAIVALVKVRRLVAQGGGAADMALQTMQRQAMVGIGIGVVAFGFNAVSLALVLPAFIEAMQSGDYAALLDGSGAASSASDAGSSTGKGSVWG